jgi:hypothetical protein
MNKKGVELFYRFKEEESEGKEEREIMEVQKCLCVSFEDETTHK